MSFPRKLNEVLLEDRWRTTIVTARHNMPHTRKGYHRKAWVYSDGSVDVIVGYKGKGKESPELIRYDNRLEFLEDWES